MKADMFDWFAARFADMRFDAWEAVGLAGEGMFFARILVQWAGSERARRPVLPMGYWYLSLVGAAVLVFYALHLGSFAVLLPQLVGGIFYVRGMQLEIRHRRERRVRAAAGFDRPGFPWPALSVIVPVHNEAAALADFLRALARRAREYAEAGGPPVEIVVAANGCSDGSEDVARAVAEESDGEGGRDRPAWRLVEDARAGMSFGKNLGAGRATGSLWLFVDADSALPPEGLRAVVESLHGIRRPVATVAGRPDRGGGVVRTCFWIANRRTRRARAHAPGGVMAMTPEVFAAAGGFDETLPQGTSTDFLDRAREAGAEYVFIDRIQATTSIRRFEKTGIVRQLLAWRKNHRDLRGGRREAVRRRAYDNIR